MKTSRPPVEPPIILKALPAWMWARDVLLTVGAWMLIGYFLREGLYLAVRLLPRTNFRAHERHGARLGRGMGTPARLRVAGGDSHRVDHLLGV